MIVDLKITSLSNRESKRFTQKYMKVFDDLEIALKFQDFLGL